MKLKLKDLKKGMKVRYIPTHAKEDKNHPDCEDGVVSSVGRVNVFVKYNNKMCIMVTGDELYTAQATDPNDLILR